VENFFTRRIKLASTARVFRSDSPGKSCAVVGQVHSWKLRGVVISHSFNSVRADVSSSVINACTAFPSTLVSMLELSPPLPVLLLLHIGGLSRLNTRALATWLTCVKGQCTHICQTHVSSTPASVLHEKHSMSHVVRYVEMQNVTWDMQWNKCLCMKSLKKAV
jgi:hypothetical protein